MNEIVFIGLQIDKKLIREQLEICHCNPDEIMDLQDGFFYNKDASLITRADKNAVETAVLNQE